MSLSSVFTALTFIALGIVGLGLLPLDMVIVYVLAIIAGIVIFVEGSGVLKR